MIIHRLKLTVFSFLAVVGLAVGGGFWFESQRAQALPNPFEVAVDCDTATPGVQLDCTFPTGTTVVAVDVTLTNTSGASSNIAAFNFILNNDNKPVFAPATPTCFAPGTDCNPDFMMSGAGWSCGPPNPIPDTNQDADPNTSESNISCFNASDPPPIADGASAVLARVTYNVTGDGAAALAVSNVNIFDDFGAEIHACRPGSGGDCFDAAVAVGVVLEPTATDTLEPTATDTVPPTATDTAEPTATETSVPTATDTVEPTATNTPEPTATETPIPTETNTPLPGETFTFTPSPTETLTPEPTATETPEPTATETEVPTATNTTEPGVPTDTPEPTATETEVPTATNTTVASETATTEPTATDTASPTSTNTPVPTATDTATPTSTNTSVPTATNTSEPETATPSPAATTTVTPTMTPPPDFCLTLGQKLQLLIQVLLRLGTEEGDRRYKARYDLDHDGDIDLHDVRLIFEIPTCPKRWGHHWW